MADSDFLGVDKDEGTGNYRRIEPSANTHAETVLPLPPHIQILILACQACLMFILAIGNSVYDLRGRIRSLLSELIRILIFMIANNLTVRFLYKGFDLMTRPQFQEWVNNDALVAISWIFIFVLLQAMLHVLQFGYGFRRQEFGIIHEVVHSERFYVFVIIGYGFILGLKLLACILTVVFIN